MRVRYEKLSNHLEEKEAALKNALDELNAKVNPVTVVGLGKNVSMQHIIFQQALSHIHVHDSTSV